MGLFGEIKMCERIIIATENVFREITYSAIIVVVLWFSGKTIFELSKYLKDKTMESMSQDLLRKILL